MRFSDLNSRARKEAAREEIKPVPAAPEAGPAAPGRDTAEPRFPMPLDAPFADFPEPVKTPDSPDAGTPPRPSAAVEPSPAVTPSKRLVSRREQQRKDEAAVRAAERPFQELDAEAKEAYSRTVSLSKEFLGQVDQPYVEKYERLLRMAEMNARTLLENQVLLNYTAYATADNYLYAHSANVSILSQAMGQAMGLDKNVVAFLGFCAIAHDIGMTEYAGLVNTPGRLSDEEYSEVTRHSEKGAAKIDRLLDMDHRLKDRARKVIMQAHERIDGTGYPDRLINEEIDPLSQIIGIADVYEAMSHPRQWRPATHPHLSVKHLIDKEGRGFGSKVVKAIIEVLSIYPPGSLVALTSGEIVRVIRSNKGSLTRPVVSVLLDPDFAPAAPRHIDLMEHPLTGIERIVEGSELAARNPKFSARQELARWWVDW